jgi:uncharacterized membrane protein YbhN (UPF0104 family)
VLGVLFVTVVLIVVVRKMAAIDWPEVWQGLHAFQWRTLLPAVLLACASYTMHSGFDWLGRLYARHRLPLSRVMAIGFVGYAFNVNFGAMVGGLALRGRLYARAGLPATQIAAVYSIGVISNWVGYMFLAGATLTFRLLPLPAEWGIPELALRAFGFLLLAGATAYVLMCALSRRRTWTIKTFTVELPSLRFALLQCAVSMTNWMTIAAIINLLLPPQASYPVVLGVVLIGSVAGAVTHIPAGLGVLETVFLVLLGDQVPHGALIAGLIAYRAIYYFAPLLFAVATYFWLEASNRRVPVSCVGDEAAMPACLDPGPTAPVESAAIAAGARAATQPTGPRDQRHAPRHGAAATENK